MNILGILCYLYIESTGTNISLVEPHLIPILEKK
jgi:hypothetical protein